METTLVPFSTLPACASGCQNLWDANGFCAPTGTTKAASAYEACFCTQSGLQPLSTGGDVCSGACPSTDLSAIENWFTGYCAQGAAATSSSAPSSSGSSGSSGSSAGGPWISTHWQWVVMIVVIIVAIAGIWAGACVWRRKYLRKKDRMYELGKGLPSSVAVNTQGNLVGPGVRGSTISQPGMFMSGSASGPKA